MLELYKLNFTDQEITNLLEENPHLKEQSPEEINNLISILKQIDCTNEDIKNILIANPFYLTSFDTDIINLINKLKEIGLSNLKYLFESNPYLLNKEVYEIENFIKEQQKKYSKEEIIDLLDANPYLIDL